MFKIILVFALLSKMFIAAVPTPEIAAEVVPNFSSSVLPNFAAPITERGPGHRGVDIPDAAAVASPFSGSVSFVGKVYNRNVITVTSGRLRASLEPVCTNLRAGQVVSAGQEIAQYCPVDEGYEEHCEKCVHFSIRNERGYLNPLLFYGLVRASELLP